MSDFVVNRSSYDRDRHPDLPEEAVSPEEAVLFEEEAVLFEEEAGQPVLIVAPKPDAFQWLGQLFRTQSLRATALVIAVIPLGLFAVASRLQPNTSGLGTHQQLGLPPCSMRVMFSVRCPGCGMTTSWAHFVRGQWKESIRVNLGGFLLACLSLTVSFLALRTFWLLRPPSLMTQKVVTFISVGIMAVTFLDWIRRLAE